MFNSEKSVVLICSLLEVNINATSSGQFLVFSIIHLSSSICLHIVGNAIDGVLVTCSLIKYLAPDELEKYITGNLLFSGFHVKLEVDA